MRDIYAKMRSWQDQGLRTALATVVKTWRSSPRQAGASMIIGENLEIFGSVSGGCVEGAVAKEAVHSLERGESKLLSFGVSNEDAWKVGLSCGGGIKVLVRPFDQKSGLEAALLQELEDTVSGDGALTMLTALDSSGTVGWISDRSELLPSHWSAAQLEQVRAIHTRGVSAPFDMEASSYFAHVVPRKRQLLIIGAAHITVDLLKMAQQLGFSPRVIDPRGLFTDSIKGLCNEDRLHRAWPADVLPTLKLDQNCYAVLLTHDPKIDDQALHLLLPSGIRYIGALGSRKTHQRRLERLHAAGFSPEVTARIHGPVGMELGALTPAEIALSIVAEMTVVYNEVIP